MRITVVGTGYVGLVVGTCFAETGHTVYCVDKNPKIIDRLKDGQIPIFEPGLEELVVRNAEEERLFFTTDLADAVGRSTIVFLCVGTPEGEEGRADLSQVLGAADEVGKAIQGYAIVVSKSTCPVGTCDQIREILSKSTDHEFDVVSNPEFLKEGAAVDDFLRPDRVVIGTDNVRVEQIMKELYEPFLRTGKPILGMDIRSAEFTKYACNTMLACRISMMNEFATLADALGADIARVREGMATDTRIGSGFLFPGIGFGGSCFPKDVRALSHLAHDANQPSHMVDAIRAVNLEQRQRFIERIRGHYEGNLSGKKLAIWGATFKPKTDDLREAPALDVINAMLDDGASICVYDPEGMPGLIEQFGNRISTATKAYQALTGANGLVICTEWNEFRRPDFERMAELMDDNVIFDGRNLYKPETLAKANFTYYSIGRPTV